MTVGCRLFHNCMATQLNARLPEQLLMRGTVLFSATAIPHQRYPLQLHNGIAITSSMSVRNLGAIFDSNMIMADPINSVTHTFFVNFDNSVLYDAAYLIMLLKCLCKHLY